ncbi:MAG: hypothetical protein LC126_07725 [Bryobacterales bacterium]|nr:hypothetical protein [Bryobacterales bacterium]
MHFPAGYFRRAPAAAANTARSLCSGAAKTGWDPREEIRCYEDLDKFGNFRDEWLRGGTVRRWAPKAHAGSPISVFKTRGNYEMFSETLPEERFRLVPAARAGFGLRWSTWLSTAG